MSQKKLHFKYKRLENATARSVKKTDSIGMRSRMGAKGSDRSARLARPFTEQYDFGGLQEHQEIQEQSLVTHVVQVELELVEGVLL